MKYKLLPIILVLLLGFILSKNVMSQDQLDAPDEAISELIFTALEEEHYAKRQFLEVLKLKPSLKIFQMFRNIAVAEQNHVEQILHIARKYEIEVPAEIENTKEVVKIETIKQACEVGFQLESDKFLLYKDELLPTVPENYPDLKATFTRVAVDAKNRLERFFKRCLDLYEKAGY